MVQKVAVQDPPARELCKMHEDLHPARLAGGVVCQRWVIDHIQPVGHRVILVLSPRVALVTAQGCHYVVHPTPKELVPRPSKFDVMWVGDEKVNEHEMVGVQVKNM